MKKLLLLLALTGCEDDPVDVAVFEKNSAGFEARSGVKKADCGHCGARWCCNGVLEGKPVQYACNQTKCWWYLECAR